MKNTLGKEELDIYLKYLDMALKSDIEDINAFNRSDIVRLEKAMIVNLYNLKKYDRKTLKLSNKLDSMYERRDALNWQVGATEKDIINELSSKLISYMISIVLVSFIGTQDEYDFIKRFVISLGIYFLTFKLNLIYFTSDKRREIVEKKLSLLETKIINNQMYCELYQRISKSFSMKLDVQYDKILELCPEINETAIKTKRRK